MFLKKKPSNGLGVDLVPDKGFGLFVNKAKGAPSSRAATPERLVNSPGEIIDVSDALEIVTVPDLPSTQSTPRASAPREKAPAADMLKGLLTGAGNRKPLTSPSRQAGPLAEKAQINERPEPQGLPPFPELPELSAEFLAEEVLPEPRDPLPVAAVSDSHVTEPATPPLAQPSFDRVEDEMPATPPAPAASEPMPKPSSGLGAGLKIKAKVSDAKPEAVARPASANPFAGFTAKTKKPETKPSEENSKGGSPRALPWQFAVIGALAFVSFTSFTGWKAWEAQSEAQSQITQEQLSATASHKAFNEKLISSSSSFVRTQGLDVARALQTARTIWYEGTKVTLKATADSSVYTLVPLEPSKATDPNSPSANSTAEQPVLRPQLIDGCKSTAPSLTGATDAQKTTYVCENSSGYFAAYRVR